MILTRGWGSATWSAAASTCLKSPILRCAWPIRFLQSNVKNLLVKVTGVMCNDYDSHDGHKVDGYY